MFCLKSVLHTIVSETLVLFTPVNERKNLFTGGGGGGGMLSELIKTDHKMLPDLAHDLAHHKCRHISADQFEHKHPILHEVVGHKVAQLHPDAWSVSDLLSRHWVLVNRTQVSLDELFLNIASWMTLCLPGP